MPPSLYPGELLPSPAEQAGKSAEVVIPGRVLATKKFASERVDRKAEK
jgi:hypothetical protein